MKISVVIPVLNEAAAIGGVLARLPEAVEVIVVDGGSVDGTQQQAQAAGVMLVNAARGRAIQMNAGAAVASGDVLVFLHADTCLPGTFVSTLAEFERSPSSWGRFEVLLSGPHVMFRVIERMMNWRSRLTGICTGDQVMFVRREVFESVGGFAPVPLMEDIELSRRLLKFSRPFCARPAVVTSSRRWEQHGIIKTVLLMWRLRLAYFFGASPEQLVRRYYG